jgi:hypothetical protein
MKRVSALCIASIFGLLILAMSCNNSTNPQTSTKPLQLLEPVAPPTEKVGQPVTIRWRINDLTQIASVGVELSIDSGSTWVFELADHVLSVDTTTITWMPTIDQVSTKCFIRVYKYGEAYVNDKSGMFAVTN